MVDAARGGGRARRARRPVRRLRARPLVTAALLAVTACRSYAPVAPGQTPAGRAVRVRLTPDGGSALAATIGPRGTALEGTLVAGDDSSVTMDVRAVTRADGDDERWPGERLTVARRAVAGMDVVRTSVGRSVLLAGGVVAALALLRTAFGGDEGISRVPGGASGGSGR